MGSHPINLAVRFLLELTALGSFAYWGWTHINGWPRVIVAILLPVLVAATWAVFAVPDDPSRSGSTVVATPGFIRLLFELAFFGASVWVLLASRMLGVGFGVIVVIHYVISYDRIIWLLAH